MSLSTNPTRNITLVGCGHMGAAMLRFWLQNCKDMSFTVVSPDLPDVFHGNCTHLHPAKDFPAGFAPAAIVFAVRPNQLPDALPAYKDFDCPKISIAAGTPVATLRKFLGHDTPIVRAMPNLPASIGAAATVAYAAEPLDNDHQQLVQSLFEAFGVLTWVEEETLVDAATAISGSGPGYVFAFAEALRLAAVDLGLPPATADILVRQTLAGSGALLAEPDAQPLAELAAYVASPGGTTEAAFKIFEEDGTLQNLVKTAAQAAFQRAREISCS